ncbi:MAG: choice-of-anchor D domain-containing protein [Rhodobacterales bacterium]|nr:choice-of-anchor D domain-containing protein [Rhodobacterales bacterium]
MRPLLLTLLLACGPQEVQISSLTPEIAVAPMIFEFGDVSTTDEVAIPLFLSNAGRAVLEVTARIEGGDGAYSLDLETVFIDADDAVTTNVVFHPDAYLPYDATLVIDSNDQDNQLIEIPITGVGVYAPAPDICVDPPVLDFGTVAGGSSAVGILYIENCGNAPLQLGAIDQTGSGAFRLDLASDPSNHSVDGGNTQPLIIYYEPALDQGDNGALSIPSDDADEPLVEVVLLGNGGGDFDYPEAIIDCPGTSAPPDTILLDGSASFDPGGLEPLGFLWTTISKPDGSEGGLSSLITDNTSLYTDIAGDYEVQLQVTNQAGVISAPERCAINAIPADDLHIELTWDTTSVDLDLHLMQSTGASLFDTPDDCNFCNKNPQWGASGSDDDPRLDLDDRSDGPENTNILHPADGSYPVSVHYFDPIGGPATTATVTVYAYGIEVWTGSKIVQRNEVWDVGQVNWPDGTFGVYSTDLYDPARRNCQ